MRSIARKYAGGSGEWIDLAAPGSDIYSALPDNSYGYKSGTSFACAYVSGIAALPVASSVR